MKKFPQCVSEKLSGEQLRVKQTSPGEKKSAFNLLREKTDCKIIPPQSTFKKAIPELFIVARDPQLRCCSRFPAFEAFQMKFDTFPR